MPGHPEPLSLHLMLKDNYGNVIQEIVILLDDPRFEIRPQQYNLPEVLDHITKEFERVMMAVAVQSL